MNIFLQRLGQSELAPILEKLSSVARENIHTLVDSPDKADIIVLCGSWTTEGAVRLLTANPLIKQYPTKCVVHSDDDAYLPLLPGVYCSPKIGYSTKRGRVRSYSYIVRHVEKGNPFVATSREPQEKELLFSFQGSNSSFVRKRLFNMNVHRNDILIEDTTHHQNWVLSGTRTKQQEAYVTNISRSHFVLCPRGSGTGSVRLFEVMSLGVAPVVISDRYVLPEGPDWNSFLIRVPEKDIANLVSILEAHRSESVLRGKRAKEAWSRWFATEEEFNQIVMRCQSALVACTGWETLYRRLWPFMILKHYSFRLVRRSTRRLILRTVRLLGLRMPYSIRDQPPHEFDPTCTRDDIG